jgi:hypothetical protein
MCGAIPPLPSTSSWCGAQLKKKEAQGTIVPITFSIHGQKLPM